MNLTKGSLILIFVLIWDSVFGHPEETRMRSCPAGYTLVNDGEESEGVCEMAEIQDPIYSCPNGTVERAGLCLSFVPAHFECPRGYSMIEQECVRAEEAPPILSCEEGELKDTACLVTEDHPASCPKEYEMVKLEDDDEADADNDEVDDESADFEESARDGSQANVTSAEEGQTNSTDSVNGTRVTEKHYKPRKGERGICRNVTKPVDTCPEGTELVDDDCVERLSQPPTVECPEDAEYDDAQKTCYVIKEIPAKCSSGFELKNGTCYSSVPSERSPCPDGYKLDDEECRKVVTLNPVVECPNDTTLDEDKLECYTEVDEPPTCPDGFSLSDELNDTCVRFFPATFECAKHQGSRDVGGRCKMLVEVPMSPICPKGYAYIGGSCRKFQESTPVLDCLGGTLKGKMCVTKTRVNPIYSCPDGTNIVPTPKGVKCSRMVKEECPLGTRAQRCTMPGYVDYVEARGGAGNSKSETSSSLPARIASVPERATRLNEPSDAVYSLPTVPISYSRSGRYVAAPDTTSRGPRYGSYGTVHYPRRLVAEESREIVQHLAGTNQNDYKNKPSRRRSNLTHSEITAFTRDSQPVLDGRAANIVTEALHGPSAPIGIPISPSRTSMLLDGDRTRRRAEWMIQDMSHSSHGTPPLRFLAPDGSSSGDRQVHVPVSSVTYGTQGQAWANHMHLTEKSGNAAVYSSESRSDGTTCRYGQVIVKRDCVTERLVDPEIACPNGARESGQLVRSSKSSRCEVDIMYPPVRRCWKGSLLEEMTEKCFTIRTRQPVWDCPKGERTTGGNCNVWEDVASKPSCPENTSLVPTHRGSVFYNRATCTEQAIATPGRSEKSSQKAIVRCEVGELDEDDRKCILKASVPVEYGCKNGTLTKERKCEITETPTPASHERIDLQPEKLLCPDDYDLSDDGEECVRLIKKDKLKTCKHGGVLDEEKEKCIRETAVEPAVKLEVQRPALISCPEKSKLAVRKRPDGTPGSPKCMKYTKTVATQVCPEDYSITRLHDYNNRDRNAQNADGRRQAESHTIARVYGMGQGDGQEGILSRRRPRHRAGIMCAKPQKKTVECANNAVITAEGSCVLKRHVPVRLTIVRTCSKGEGCNTD